MILDLESQVYTEWSLGQKKAFSAFEKKANTDFQSIKKNLGDHWTVTFLWEEMAKNCPQDAPNKDKVGKQIYESKFANLAKELASLDAEVVSALNDAVGSDTNITITIGEDKEKYLNGMDEVRYEGPQGGLKFVFPPESYSHLIRSMETNLASRHISCPSCNVVRRVSKLSKMKKVFFTSMWDNGSWI